jgi:hypothetical protein
MLSLLLTRLDLADEDELSRFARLYGGTVQRLVMSCPGSRAGTGSIPCSSTSSR